MAESGTTNGVDPQGTATPATNPASQGGATAADPGDYLARIRAEPDFAVEQIREKDRKVTEISQRQKELQKKLGSLSGVIDQLGGGDGVYQQLARLDRFLGNPALRKTLEHYERTGTLPASGQDGYGMDPEPEDPQMKAISELQHKITQLESQISQTRGSVGKQSVTAALGRLRDEFPDYFDSIIRPHMDTQFEEWERNPAGREILSTLGYDQLRKLAFVAIGEAGKLEELGEKVHLRKLENLKRSATGAPGTTLTTGRESRPASKHSSAREALEEFERQGLGRVL